MSLNIISMMGGGGRPSGRPPVPKTDGKNAVPTSLDLNMSLDIISMMGGGGRPEGRPPVPKTDGKNAVPTSLDLNMSLDIISMMGGGGRPSGRPYRKNFLVEWVGMARHALPNETKNRPMPSSSLWRKLALYLLPFALIFVVLTAVMVYLGESMPLAWVVQMQTADDRVLYRPQYGNRDQTFKRLTVSMRHPEVLAIGSSRILQFRAGFFNRKPDTFYNAAAPAWRLPQITDLIYNLPPDSLPKVLILAIDPPWFNADYAGDVFPAPVSDVDNLWLVDRSIVQDVLKKRDFGRVGFDPSAYWGRIEPGGSGGIALGLRAIRDGHGFRSDGSEQYGDFLIAKWLGQAQQREAHLRMMRGGEQMYVYGDSVSESALGELSGLLDYAAAHDITIIGFLPSYTPTLWAEMVAGGNHTYITALTPRLQTVFDAYGFAFFDFSDGASINARDDEFFDGWHASELSNLRLYIKLLEAQPDVLGKYSDAGALYDITANATNTWDVFGLGNQP